MPRISLNEKPESIPAQSLWPLIISSFGALIAAPVYISFLDHPLIRSTGWPLFLLAGIGAISGAFYGRWDERAWVRVCGFANIALLTIFTIWFFWVAALPAPAAKALSIDRAPDFTLPDQNGRPITLSNIYSSQSVLLVFYRGLWCPVCSSELRGLAGIDEDLKKAGVRLLAVSVDAPQKSLLAAARFDFKFPLLSDADHTAIREYGVLHPRGGPDNEDVALPAQFLINREGRIVWRRIAGRIQDRPDPIDVLEIARKQSSAS